MGHNIAITFDDGPNNYTNTILDILKEKKITATFFVIGQQIEGNEAIISRMVEEGHAVENHSLTHADFNQLTLEEAQEEIKIADRLLYPYLGRETTYFRPPFGKLPEMFFSSIKKDIVFWDVDSKDWSSIKAAEIYKEVVQNLKPDSVILLHSFEETVTILPEILDYIQNNSFYPRLLSEVNSKAIIFARNL